MFLKGSNCSDRTIQNYCFYFDRFLDSHWEVYKSANSTDDLQLELETFIETLNSISAKRLALTSFRQFARMAGLNPEIFRVRMPRIVRKGVSHLTPEQVCDILEESKLNESDFMSARNTAMLAVFSYLGLRLSELNGLKVNDIDFEAKTIRVLGKGNKIGHVPIIKAVASHLEWWLHIRKDHSRSDYLWITEQGNKLSKRAIQYVVTGYVKKFDDGLSTHSLRHTAATTLINKGVDLKTVSTLLRHSNLNTTADIYAHKSVDAVGEDMDKVYGG